MPCSVPLKGNRCGVPSSMVRNYRVEVRNADGSWRTVCREQDNHQRLVRLPVAAHTTSVRITPESSWGDEAMRVFSIDLLERTPERIGVAPEGAGVAGSGAEGALRRSG